LDPFVFPPAKKRQPIQAQYTRLVLICHLWAFRLYQDSCLEASGFSYGEEERGGPAPRCPCLLSVHLPIPNVCTTLSLAL